MCTFPLRSLPRALTLQNGSSIVFTYYINLVDLGTIGLEMSMIHKRKSMARILASIVKVQVSYKTHAVVISCVQSFKTKLIQTSNATKIKWISIWLKIFIIVIPATVNLDDSLAPSWFLHSTVVSLLANLLDAFTWRVDVKSELLPLLVMLIRVAVKEDLDTTTGAAGSIEKIIGSWLMSGPYHWRTNDPFTWQVKVANSPSQANFLLFCSTVEVSTTLPATEQP